jgi:hypothetical protein
MKEPPYYRDLLTVNLLKWQEWERRGLLLEYYDELSYDFLFICYVGYLKLLLLRLKKPFDEFQILKREVLARIPDYNDNPYLAGYFSPFSRLLVSLLNLPVTPDVFEQVAIKARLHWQSVRIFVAAHMKFSPPKDTVYQPFHVGRATGGDLGFLGDDTGDNISALNKYYGELTGLYWIWKNYPTTAYVGLCHCRGYFINGESREPLTKEGYVRLLMEYDVIISLPTHSKTESYYQMYQRLHNIRDLLAVEETIRKLYPEYLPYYQEIIHGKDVLGGSFLVAQKSTLDAYCEWLFAVCKEVSPEIRPDAYDYDSCHRGIYGFMSGQLLLVWIRANGLTWYGCPIGLSSNTA